MTRKEVVTLEDDLDGSTEGVRTVEFAFEDGKYEIDLSREHYYQFKDKIMPYIERARTAGRSRPVPGKPRPPESRERAAAIRTWARRNDVPVDDRGRIPARVLSQYEQAHKEGNQK